MILIVDLQSASAIPALAEPWFLTFHAEVELRPTMSRAELKESGLETLGKK